MNDLTDYCNKSIVHWFLQDLLTLGGASVPGGSAALKVQLQKTMVNSLYKLAPPTLVSMVSHQLALFRQYYEIVWFSKWSPKLILQQGPGSKRCYQYSRPTRSCWRTCKNLEKVSVYPPWNVFVERKSRSRLDGQNHLKSCQPI